MIIEPRNNYEEELQRAELTARSFEELKPPTDAVLIGIVHEFDDTYYYYKTDDGNYLYDTASGRALKQLLKMNTKKEQTTKVCPMNNKY